MPTKRRSASESAKRQAMPRSAPIPSKYPIKQRTEVDAWRQRRTTELRRVELRAKIFDKPVEALRIQNGVQTLIKWMSRRGGQLRVCHPQILLPLSMVPSAHRHKQSLQTSPVDTPTTSRKRIMTCTMGC
jgi:hypothetical protein